MENKYPYFCVALISVFFYSLVFSVSALSQNRDEVNFEIVSGSATFTPSGFGGVVKPTEAELSGTFVGFLPGGGDQLFFTSSSIVTSPQLVFRLPKDPNLDSGGTTRQATFTVDENGLSVRGKVDSRAFDGPLIEYSFVAKPVSAEFSDYDIFSARPDLRKCVAPLCGGFFVKRVNHVKTRCADGIKQAECYVANASLKGDPFIASANNSLDNSSPYLFRGEIVTKDYANFGNLGFLKAVEVYRSTAKFDGRARFYGLKDNGVRCITVPCYSTNAQVLNRKKVYDISAYELENAGADEQEINQALGMIGGGGVLLISGKIRSVDEQLGRIVRVEQIFLPIYLENKHCKKGYSYKNGACKTPYGCLFPQLELTETGGAAPLVDSTRRRLPAIAVKSCIESCNPPGFESSAGQCTLYFP